MKKLQFYSILFLLFISFKAAAQTKKSSTVDSIKIELSKKSNDTTHIGLLLKLSELVAYSNPDSAILISKEVVEFANQKVSGANIDK